MEKPWGQICHCHIQLIQRTRQRPGRYDLIRYLKSFTISKIHFKLCKNHITKWVILVVRTWWSSCAERVKPLQNSAWSSNLEILSLSWCMTWRNHRQLQNSQQSSTYISYYIRKRIALRSALILYEWYKSYKRNNYGHLHVMECSRYIKHKDCSIYSCKLPEACAPKWGRIWKFA